MRIDINRDIGKSLLIIGLLCIQFVLLGSSAAFSRNNTVNGVVTDANIGETLRGVNIALHGTTSGTSTDVRGHYSLKVPSLNDTLTFSFIGYQTREVPINGRSEIDVSLKTQAFKGQELDP